MLCKIKINARAGGGKKNVNWVLSFSLKASAYNFARAEANLKD
jgi:hypothetical protein